MKNRIDIMRRIRNHPLIDLLLNLRGNPRVLVWIEPLWGIPQNLIAPFVGLYMYALGVDDKGIGLIASITLAVQPVFSFLGGIVADKIGRKATTMLGDMLGWSVACLVWAVSQNFWFFVVASLLNCFEQVNQTAWTCLLIEDADKRQIVNIYTWITIGGLTAVFFAPLSGVLIGAFSLVPVMRAFYILFTVGMIAKTFITWKFTAETEQGKIRMAETKNTSMWKMVKGYKTLLPGIFKNRGVLQILAVMVILNITSMVSSNFFGLYVSKSLGVAEEVLSFFPIIRAVVMIIFMFGLQHKIPTLKIPMEVGFALFFAAQLVLVFAPHMQIAPLVLVIFLEAIAHALVWPRKESMVVHKVDAQERARIVALLTSFTMALTAPFAYLTGVLSSINRSLPFVLTTGLYVIAFLVVLRMREPKPEEIMEA